MTPFPNLAAGPDNFASNRVEPWVSNRPIEASLLATRTLIVEDEALIAWSLESYLEDFGFTDIEIVDNGKSAIAAAGARTPGLIISDINLGGDTDGVTVAGEISQSKSIPIVFVSGYAGPDMRSRIALELPRALILPKPVQLIDLRAAILSAFGSVRHQ